MIYSKVGDSSHKLDVVVGGIIFLEFNWRCLLTLVDVVSIETFQ